MSDQEKRRQQAYLNLIRQAETRSFWGGIQGTDVVGLAAPFAQAVIDAIALELSPHDIKIAVQMGELKGRTKPVRPLLTDFDPLPRRLKPLGIETKSVYYPALWISHDELLEAMNDFSQIMDQLTDEQIQDLIRQMEVPLRQLYLASVPTVLARLLNED